MVVSASEPSVSHLHTFFLFPFSIDREHVQTRHPDIWLEGRWMDGLDRWIANHMPPEGLGHWERASHVRFDAESSAYQDMVFFHPFVRRIFFDTGDQNHCGDGEQESLLRRYKIALPEDARFVLEAEDLRGRSASAQVTTLTLFLFANGIGLLSIGVEGVNVPAKQALWMNEMMRKIYPSSGRQQREGRVPSRVALSVERRGEPRALVEERFDHCDIHAFQPPLSALVARLLYFADYPAQEYEPVLDERMIVYSYLALDPRSVPENWLASEAEDVFVSRAVYVDHHGADYRYQPDFTRHMMEKQVYRRWAHQGTFYGFTSYSTVTVTLGEFDCDDHQLREGFLIHRMFRSRYYLMMLVAVFYRATLLDYAERVALVSRRLNRDFEDERLSIETIRFVNALRNEFLNFSNYWHFEELANKDEETEHFNLMCDAYRIRPMLMDTEREIDRLHDALSEYYQSRNTQAVNRLAMISMILGAGAVLTGFFGMNFGGEFAKLFFEPSARWTLAHWLSIAAVSAFALGAVSFGLFVVAANWSDYRDVLLPGGRAKRIKLDSIKHVD
ncbi:MAG: CorA family divalent cation transporter [Bryobacteraceae bacterium]|nr:CorA family divalent cation transporter [Bryobacteraceae bacterium]